MSGFASKLSAAGTKGWKDFQSLWGEPKTTLTSADTSPGEKSSLLGRSSYGSGDDSSKSHLLGDDDEAWGDWGQDSDWSSSKKASKNNSSDWSAGNEDDLEAWLNDDDTSGLSSGGKSKSKKKSEDDWNSWKTTDSSSKSSGKSSSSSLTSKSKKKSQKSSTAVSSSDGWDDADWNSGLSGTSSKQKQPLVGNLLDLDDDTAGAGTRGGANDGWDNEVWAQDDDDEWQTLELSTDNKKAS